MKIKFNQAGVCAMALGALALAGCDSVKDVRSDPATELPAEREVLKGVITGLGGGRAITLTYNGGARNISLVGADPAFPTTTPEEVPFTFGSIAVGTQFNVVVADGGQPFGKVCTPVSGNTGTLVKGQETNVVLNCVPDIPRYDLTVALPTLPADFSGKRNPRVTVYTGEQMRQLSVTSGQTSVTFDDALFSATITIPNPNGPGTVVVAAGAPLTYYVLASFVDDAGLENRCLVNNYSGSNPPGNVTNVSVGACDFTLTGSVVYNAPPGGAAETGTIPGGLALEVRDMQENVKTSYEVSAYGNFTVGGTVTPVRFPSNVNSNFDVVVTRQPTDRTCVVGDGGAVSLYRTGSTTPANVTPTGVAGAVAGTRAWGSRLNVVCRMRPATGRELAGTYRLSSSTWKAAPTTANPNPQPITAPYNNYDWTVQNMGSSNMLTFFADGTFLYGTHAYIAGTLPDGLAAAPWSVQVEHGFYDYNPAGTLRFTLITDTNPTGVFPTTYSATDNIVWNAARTGAHGLSGAPAPTVTAAATAGAGIGVWTAVMNNVQKSTVVFGQGRNPAQVLRRITGTFGGADAAAARLDWQLTEPQSLAGEMTGTWVSRDNRRFWVWDYLTYYGTHVGVANGSPSMNDACFTVAQASASYGVYTRRGSSTGCYPYNRPARSTAYLFGVAEAADFHLTDTTLASNTFTGVASLAFGIAAVTPTNPLGPLGPVPASRLVPQFGSTALRVLPGFAGRIPGGQSAADGRSPSPVVYKIAPAASFAASVATTVFEDIGEPASRYFDDVGTPGKFAWCPTDILGIRATRNGEPLNFPVYFCRTRATP
jgi:hypothetical protein